MTPPWFDLTGKTALVTGGSKGLGRAIAGALLRAGAGVAIASRTQADLDRAAAELGEHGGRVLPVCADVTDEPSIDALVQRVLAQWGQIDILVNNAGIEGSGAVVEMEASDWDRVMNVNLRGPMLCCKHVGPHMIRRRAGKVINVASVMAVRVSRYMAPYAASKAALVQFTRTLALEWISHNIQVNALCPGYFDTPMNQEFFGSDTGRRVIERLPIKRLGQVHEIEGAAVFLASGATSYMTGAALYVDGGHALA
ncbi:MAG: SDR family oxidoreductase [Deltaproteobacteria bacterium]|nr:SDR family oxidoreductase [Deltaproteobacteria bacterium]